MYKETHEEQKRKARNKVTRHSSKSGPQATKTICFLTQLSKRGKGAPQKTVHSMYKNRVRKKHPNESNHLYRPPYIFKAPSFGYQKSISGNSPKTVSVLNSVRVSHRATAFIGYSYIRKEAFTLVNLAIWGRLIG